REGWIGGEFGLQRFHDGRLFEVRAVDDELLRGISGIVERKNGDLWLNGLAGIVHLDHAEVAAASSDPAHRAAAERFGHRDGLPGLAAQLRPIPTAIEGSDGRLWFASSNGVVCLDPDRARPPAPAIPVTIQAVLADDVPYTAGGPMRFPPHTASVQLAFTAISLSSPGAIRYRYRLREADADWHE